LVVVAALAAPLGIMVTPLRPVPFRVTCPESVNEPVVVGVAVKFAVWPRLTLGAGCLEVVALLLRLGVDPNIQGRGDHPCKLEKDGGTQKVHGHEQANCQ
jgi:hypothetical protein